MLTLTIGDDEDTTYLFSLTKIFCQKIYDTEIWKTWKMDYVVRLQLQSSFSILPKEVFENYLKIVFNLKEIPDPPNYGPVIVTNYKQKWGNPLTLKEIVSWVPKSFLYNIVK